MTKKVKFHGNIKTTTVSAMMMGDERQQTLQAKIRGTEQTWTVVRLPANEVLNYRKLGSRTFKDQIQVIDERHWKFPVVDEKEAVVYIALRPYELTDAKYHTIVRSLVGLDVFEAYKNGIALELDCRQATNITLRLPAGLV